MQPRCDPVGVMSLVALHRWRQHGRLAEGMQLPSHTPSKKEVNGGGHSAETTERPLLSSAVSTARAEPSAGGPSALSARRLKAHFQPNCGV